MASGSGRGLTSLYADLLEPKSTSSDKPPATISKAPVVFTSGESNTIVPSSGADNDTPASAKKPVSSAALRFQPIPRRPQPAQQKTTKKAGGATGLARFAKVAKAETTGNQEGTAPAISTAPTIARAAPVVKSSLEDWATNDDDDVNGFYGGNTRQRGGRKRRKKNKDKDFEMVTHSWDDIYDPSRPNNYEEYKDSEEKEAEMRDWRDRLYGRRRAFSSDESDDDRDRYAGMQRFAPPPSLSFAPPKSYDDEKPKEPAPVAEPAAMLDAPTGEEIWQMRARLSQPAAAGNTSTPFVRPSQPSPPPPPPPSTVSAVPGPTATISRAPVIYKLPPAPDDIPSEEQLLAEEEEDMEEGDAMDTDPQEETAGDADKPRSVRPGQQGFAERLMAKYGWTKGSGLGATSSGMVHALHMKASKGKDAKGMGKIIDKNKRTKEEEQGKFGKMSEVVVLHKMVDGLEDEDMGVLMQEIGDECSEKYGRIERVHIVHRETEEASSKVFVQFTSQLSALRAVNALEGRIFNGNVIEAKFFDTEKFERRELE